MTIKKRKKKPFESEQNDRVVYNRQKRIPSFTFSFVFFSLLPWKGGGEKLMCTRVIQHSSSSSPLFLLIRLSQPLPLLRDTHWHCTSKYRGPLLLLFKYLLELRNNKRATFQRAKRIISFLLFPPERSPKSRRQTSNVFVIKPRGKGGEGEERLKKLQKFEHFKSYFDLCI